MKKVLILSENTDNYRTQRFQEESIKKKLHITIITVYKIIFRNESIFCKKESLNLDNYDYIWMISNSEVNHYILKTQSNIQNKCWINRESIDFYDKFYTNHFFEKIGVPTPKTSSLLIKRK